MSEEPLSIARAYHDAWSGDDVERAISLLADDLRVEVPINDYASTEEFASALRAFAALTTGVELLSEMSAADQAMLLYDMEVEGLGTMRVAEHFTVASGRIARLRQVHDTADLRAAGFAGASAA